MPLDHYVSQVHLRKFLSPELGNRMHAIRKSDLYRFTPRPEDVCRIPDGSTNEYLSEPRAVEDFLKLVEPRYNQAVQAAENRALDPDAVLAIAGFAAYVYACSPTGMRLASEPLRATTEVETVILERQGKLPPVPDVLGSDSLTDLISSGAVKIEIDGKFPQAIGVSQILSLATQLGNFAWEFLENNHSDSPFFTSDFPVGLEPVGDTMILNKIVPLSPTLAVRIIPNPELKHEELNTSFEHFRCGFRRPSANEVREINRLIFRCAENLVFFRDEKPWIRRFAERNRSFRLECRMHKIPTGTGYYVISDQGVAPFGHEDEGQ